LQFIRRGPRGKTRGTHPRCPPITPSRDVSARRQVLLVGIQAPPGIWTTARYESASIWSGRTTYAMFKCHDIRPPKRDQIPVFIDRIIAGVRFAYITVQRPGKTREVGHAEVGAATVTGEMSVS